MGVTGHTACMCDEKIRLREAYRMTRTALLAATNDLGLSRGRVSEPEYTRLRWLLEVAKAAVVNAENALEKHQREHGC